MHKCAATFLGRSRGGEPSLLTAASSTGGDSSIDLLSEMGKC